MNNYNQSIDANTCSQARSVAGLGSSQTSIKQRQIPEQLDAGEKLLCDLHQVIGSLESQCQPLLTPTPVAPCKDGPPVQPPQQVVERLLSSNRAIEHAIRRINELREGLHI